jgi:uncharacterized protein YeaO (DUF488 family)
MPSGYTRKSVGHVLNDPQPDVEYYVFCARGWSSWIPADEGDLEAAPFDEWDRELAPSPQLIAEYDPNEPWAAWARQYLAEVGEDTIR